MNGDDEKDADVSAPGMRATRENIAEMRDGRAVLTIVREKVDGVALGRGVAAERPILEGLVGVALLVLGPWLIAGATGLFAADGHARMGLYFAAGGAFLSAIGAVLITRVVRVHDLVHVALRDGDRRKLAFSGKLTREERKRFAASLRALGWSVTSVSDD